MGLRGLLSKSGLGASILNETGCILRSKADVHNAALQHAFYAITAETGAEDANFDTGFMFSMGLMRPGSRGNVFLKSADPKATPAIRYNCFSGP
ncbi:MAG: hypothetical protein AAF636_28005 [Pseudomonadota bacterium]